MDEIERFTMDEALNEIKYLKKIFTAVRLFDEEHIHKIANYENLDSEDRLCECFSFWEKNAPCLNCVTLKAFVEKTKQEKVEIVDSSFYRVIAKYIEIDNKPYVLELINKLNNDFVHDLNETINAKNKISYYYDKVYKDILTDAYNRRFFEEKIKKSVLNAGIAMLDLDDFKLYNDIYGHTAGDEVLISIMKVIKSHLNKDEILIRYGGDEFLIVIPNITKEHFYDRLLIIKNEINNIAFLNYKGLKISVSIGCVICNNEVVANAVERADNLMYQAKNEKDFIIMDDNENNETIKPKKSNILIVDDSKMNREILSTILKNEFNIIEASSGKECISALNNFGSIISLIILDIIMPNMNGFDVLEYLNNNNYIEDIPVIVITEDATDVSIRKAYDLGATDYINRPFDAKVVYRRVFNSIKLYDKQKRLISIVTKQLREKDRNSQVMISILSHIVEFRNGESGQHVIKISKITEMLLDRVVAVSKKYKLTSDDIFLISTASSLHDIGKIAIDSSIINKKGKLTSEEFEIMKTHTIIGYDILNNLTDFKNDKIIKYAKEICRWHHERYDGNGYPDKLKNDEIPLSSQVVSIADAYDALVSKRVYKEAYSHEKALQMILDGQCGAFNPLLIKCLLQCKNQIKSLYEEGSNKDE